ncbi:MAG: glycosyltransferase, partial [Actinobacteria bacterium]|nr:glycosyltransferase [Actinomycetota bacterium]
PDAVLDGVTGLVVDGENINQIAQAVTELLSDPEKSRQMGIAGRQWIINEWSWDRWAQVFRGVLGIK